MKVTSISVHCSACDHKYDVHWISDAPESVDCSYCGSRLADIELKEIKGFVYTLSNPRILDLFKIGFTEQDPIRRAAEISRGTGVPEPYIVEAFFPSSTPAESKGSVL